MTLDSRVAAAGDLVASGGSSGGRASIYPAGDSAGRSCYYCRGEKTRRATVRFREMHGVPVVYLSRSMSVYLRWRAALP